MYEVTKSDLESLETSNMNLAENPNLQSIFVLFANFKMLPFIRHKHAET